MEISSHHQEEGDMAIPISSAYGDGHHLIQHHHHHHDDPADHQPHNHIINKPSSAPPPPPLHTIIPTNNGSSMPNTSLQQDHDHDDHPDHGHVTPVAGSFVNKKSAAAAGVVIRYRECLKNHAASMGANATDGCGEFMPSGEEGSIEALKCSACNCHRNFHRKEVEGDHDPHYHPHHNHHPMRKKFLLGHHQLGYGPAVLPARTAGPVVPHHHHHMIMSYNNNNNNNISSVGPHLPSESDEQDQDHVGGFGGGGAPVVVRPQQMMKKRFRTKFSQEQKEKMLNFAEKVGWRIQKQEESVVQQFCQEIGVKRRVLKVWMHNNKHNLAKKNKNNINLPPA